jgi:ankyrin repeat protein
MEILKRNKRKAIRIVNMQCCWQHSVTYPAVNNFLPSTLKLLNFIQCKLVNNLRTFLLQVCPSLLKAAKSGDVNIAKVLFKCSSSDSCNDNDQYRSTPLTYAAIYGHMEVVRMLLEEGANIERTDGSVYTALHQAVWNGHLDVCRLLLDWGAKVDALNKARNTPLIWAAWAGHLSIAKLLVERGADVSLKNVDGDTALDFARREGKSDVAEWLNSVSRRKGR